MLYGISSGCLYYISRPECFFLNISLNYYQKGLRDNTIQLKWCINGQAIQKTAFLCGDRLQGLINFMD